MELDDLLDRAVCEPLSPGDLDRLACLARSESAVRRVLDALVLAAVSCPAARQNLIQAATLRSPQRVYPPRKIRPPKRAFRKPPQEGLQVYITDHAVHRYIERARPDWSFTDAAAHLCKSSRQIKRIRDISGNCSIYQPIYEPNIVWIVKRRTGIIPVCLTIIEATAPIPNNPETG